MKAERVRTSPRTSSRCVGVIPACGASRRMGRDKALLPFAGSTFLARAVRALDEGGCDRVIAVVRADHPPIRAEAEAAGADILVNPDPGDGPLTSLRCALHRLEDDDEVEGVVWLPLDFPLVSAAHVAALTRADVPDAAPLALLVHEGQRGHPVLFLRPLFAELADPTLEGGARTVVHRHLVRAHTIEIDEPAVVTDVDTPEAYTALATAHGADLG